VFSSYGKGCSNELVQAVDRFLTPTPLRNSHPTGSAKGCRGAARDILVVALAGHNSQSGQLSDLNNIYVRDEEFERNSNGRVRFTFLTLGYDNV